MNHRTIAVSVAIALACAAGAITGCAGSNASRTEHDANRTLTLSQIDAKAAELVANIVSNPRFVEYKKQFDAKNGSKANIVVMLESVEDNTNNLSMWNQKRFEFYDALEEHFATNSVTMQQDLKATNSDGTRNLNYKAGRGRMDEQDSNSNYDQSTGEITTGAASKATLFMQLSVSQGEVTINGRERVEILLRAKLFDGVTKATLLTAKTNTANPGNEWKR